jgi:hypothetical protein
MLDITAFRKMDLFPTSSEENDSLAPLDALERANLCENLLECTRNQILSGGGAVLLSAIFLMLSEICLRNVGRNLVDCMLYGLEN